MRPSPFCARALRILFFLATAAGLALLAGCPEKTIVMNPGQVTPVAHSGGKKPQSGKAPVVSQPSESIPVTPKTLYEQGQYSQAEKMGSELVTKSGISAEEKTEAWEYYALSAAANKHIHLAGKILEEWSQEEPGVENSSPWQNAWLDVTMRLPALQAVEKANERMTNNPPANMQARAQAVLALKAASKGEMDTALGNMAQGGQLLGSEKADMEGALAAQLSRLDSGSFDALKAAVTSANTYTYPYSVIAFENGRRLAFSADAAQKAQGREILQGLEQKSALSNTALLTGPLAAASASASSPSSSTSVGVSGSKMNVALLLPIKGQFSNVSFKINRGASTAQQVLAKSGMGVNVIPIDTEDPGWQQKVSELPKDVIIGGPMSSAVYEQGKAASLWAGRAVFAFLPQLPASDEGVVAWRFFNSPQDQVNALISFCRTLGINGVGTLYPSDSYGSRMEGVMQQAAVGAGMSPISKNYTNPAAGDWDSIAKSFLAMRSTSPFDAAFLPDTWGNAKALVPYIFYNREDRLLLMGTGLWEQGLYKDHAPDSTYFHLAIFPGAWDPASTNEAKNELASTLSLLNAGGAGSGATDFWTALGFDFVRFAAKMGQPEGSEWNESSVNSHIASAQGMTFSMAPIHWSSGVASQEMFVLTPAENGFTKADATDFRQRLSEAKALHDKRWQDKKRK